MRGIRRECRAVLTRPALPDHIEMETFDMAAKILALSALLASLSVGCASYAPNYFPSQIGQKWDMVADVTGDVTHLEIVNAPTTDHTDAVNIHITKTEARAYWQVGAPGAESWFGMHQLPDGRWIADYNIATFDGQNMSRTEYLHFDENSYTVIPPLGAPAGDYLGHSQNTLCAGAGYCSIPLVKVMWLARISYPEVDTPIYKGRALLNEEFECGEPIDMNEINNPLKCAHELWYFAPNIGLVEIAIKWAPVDCAPNCPPGTPIPPNPPTIRRIN